MPHKQQSRSVRLYMKMSVCQYNLSTLPMSSITTPSSFVDGRLDITYYDAPRQPEERIWEGESWNEKKRDKKYIYLRMYVA